jgi:YrbI family 3-deoxy-D-manno-octulosonate 8-phosphate phosphatase
VITSTKSFPALSSIHTIGFDFDGVFTDNNVWVDETGRESVCCSRADGMAFDLVRAFVRRGRFAAELFILSKEANPVVLARAKKMRLDCHHGVTDKLRQPDRADPFAGFVYVGNDLNDLPLMRRAGFGVAPADAHPLVREVADVTMSERGGDGFVRAVIEGLLRIDQLSAQELDDLVSDR